MSFGKMNHFADIQTETVSEDSEGFCVKTVQTVASVRCSREGRHGSERWANLAAFSEATDIFRFRVIPGVAVTAAQFLVCENEHYDILSVENVKGRGMYLEVLAKKAVPSVG